MSRILVIGDVMLDEYIYGEVNRISPEAPVPVVKFQSRDIRLGGAANLAANIKALGADVQILSLYADDEAGRDLNKLAQQAQIKLNHLISQGVKCTTHKMRVSTHAQQMLRVDREEKFEPSDAQLTEGAQVLQSILAKFDWIVVSDYAKGCIQDAWMKVILVKGRSWKVLIDPKSQNWTKYRGADLMTPNFKEFKQCVSYGDSQQVLNRHSTIVPMAKALCERYNIAALLVTRGSQGMSLIQADGDLRLYAQAREVFDVSGAGDTVLAAIAQQLSQGASLSEAAVKANLAAGIAVSKKGTSIVNESELQNALREKIWHYKLQTHEQLMLQVTEARAQGKKIVFTNGCFDVIHRGHIQYLQEAAALGDLLILGLNSDESVSRLKGSQRPVNSQDDRAFVLGNLQSIDWINIFETDTPIELIQAIRPDVLVKGADYSVEEVVGREYAQEVKIVNFVDGYSTSNTLRKLEES